MINHIKSIDSRYDINNVFLYFSDIHQTSFDELYKNSKVNELTNLISAIVQGANEDFIKKKNELFNKGKINNNKSNMIYMNNKILIEFLNKIYNNLSLFILNYYNKINTKNNNLIN